MGNFLSCCRPPAANEADSPTREEPVKHISHSYIELLERVLDKADHETIALLDGTSRAVHEAVRSREICSRTNQQLVIVFRTIPKFEEGLKTEACALTHKVDVVLDLTQVIDWESLKEFFAMNVDKKLFKKVELNTSSYTRTSPARLAYVYNKFIVLLQHFEVKAAELALQVHFGADILPLLKLFNPVMLIPKAPYSDTILFNTPGHSSFLKIKLTSAQYFARALTTFSHVELELEFDETTNAVLFLEKLRQAGNYSTVNKRLKKVVLRGNLEIDDYTKIVTHMSATARIHLGKQKRNSLATFLALPPSHESYAYCLIILTMFREHFEATFINASRYEDLSKKYIVTDDYLSQDLVWSSKYKEFIKAVETQF